MPSGPRANAAKPTSQHPSLDLRGRPLECVDGIGGCAGPASASTLSRMLRGFTKILFTCAITVPTLVVVTASTASAKPSQANKCIPFVGRRGDIAVVNLTPVEGPWKETGSAALVPSSQYSTPPNAANVNFGPGRLDPNVAMAPLDNDGVACYIPQGGLTEMIVGDHLGTIKRQAFVLPQSNGAIKRVYDNRKSESIRPNGQRCFVVPGRPGDYAVINLAPVWATAAGNGQLVSSNVKNNPPVGANVNFGTGPIDPNVAITQIGRDNKVCFINSKHASVWLIADSMGAIKKTAYRPARTNGAAKRVLDTRKSNIIPPRGRRCFAVAGRPGDFAVVNLTPVLASAAGDGKLVSSNIKKRPPRIANVNFTRGSVDPNVAFTQIGTDKRVCFVNSKHGSVHLVADHLGTIKKSAFSAAHKNGGPVRVIDTRPSHLNVTSTVTGSTGPKPPNRSDMTSFCRYEWDNGRWEISYSIVVFNLPAGSRARFRLFGESLFPHTISVDASNGNAGIFGKYTTYKLPKFWSRRARIETRVGRSDASTAWVNFFANCEPGQTG